MERVSEVLQFPVVVQCIRPFSLELQLLKKLGLLLGDATAQGNIPQEFFEPRLFLEVVGFPFNKLKSPGVPRSQATVQNNLHSKRGEVDVPGFNQRIQKSGTVLNRQIEDIGV